MAALFSVVWRKMENTREIMIEAIREELRESADKDYKKFQESLIPGLTTMMGVRDARHAHIQRRNISC